jgi:hypothetical protein
MPARGPECGRQRALIACSSSGEFRLSLGQKRRVAESEVLGLEAVEALVVLRRRDRTGDRRAAREFLVPARDERRAVSDALRRRERLGGDQASERRG